MSQKKSPTRSPMGRGGATCNWCGEHTETRFRGPETMILCFMCNSQWQHKAGVRYEKYHVQKPEVDHPDRVWVHHPLPHEMETHGGRAEDFNESHKSLVGHVSLDAEIDLDNHDPHAVHSFEHDAEVAAEAAVVAAAAADGDSDAAAAADTSVEAGSVSATEEVGATKAAVEAAPAKVVTSPVRSPVQSPVRKTPQKSPRKSPKKVNVPSKRVDQANLDRIDAKLAALSASLGDVVISDSERIVTNYAHTEDAQIEVAPFDPDASTEAVSFNASNLSGTGGGAYHFYASSFESEAVGAGDLSAADIDALAASLEQDDDKPVERGIHASPEYSAHWLRSTIINRSLSESREEEEPMTPRVVLGDTSPGQTAVGHGIVRELPIRHSHTPEVLPPVQRVGVMQTIKKQVAAVPPVQQAYVLRVESPEPQTLSIASASPPAKPAPPAQ